MRGLLTALIWLSLLLSTWAEEGNEIDDFYLMRHLDAEDHWTRTSVIDASDDSIEHSLHFEYTVEDAQFVGFRMELNGTEVLLYSKLSDSFNASWPLSEDALSIDTLVPGEGQIHFFKANHQMEGLYKITLLFYNSANPEPALDSPTNGSFAPYSPALDRPTDEIQLWTMSMCNNETDITYTNEQCLLTVRGGCFGSLYPRPWEKEAYFYSKRTLEEVKTVPWVEEELPDGQWKVHIHSVFLIDEYTPKDLTFMAHASYGPFPDDSMEMGNVIEFVGDPVYTRGCFDIRMYCEDPVNNVKPPLHTGVDIPDDLDPHLNCSVSDFNKAAYKCRIELVAATTADEALLSFDCEEGCSIRWPEGSMAYRPHLKEFSCKPFADKWAEKIPQLHGVWPTCDCESTSPTTPEPDSATVQRPAFYLILFVTLFTAWD